MREYAPGSGDEQQAVRDELQYQYANTQALFIAAAGTSHTSTNNYVGVIFPASEPEVVAVTGLDEYNNPCGNCHYGQKVEFATLTNQPVMHARTTFGDPYQIRSLGGSSYSTSVISGIAALILSRYPQFTRDQVVARLRTATTRSSKYGGIGYGTPNAYYAIGGLLPPGIVGPLEVDPYMTQTYTVQHAGGWGPFTYEWDGGETTATVTRAFGGPGYYNLGVAVRDGHDGYVNSRNVIVIGLCPDGQRPAGDGSCGCPEAVMCEL